MFVMKVIVKDCVWLWISKKDMDANLILNYLYKNTDLQVSYNYNVVAIVNKRPVQNGSGTKCWMPLLNIDNEVILKRSRYDLDKKTAALSYIRGIDQSYQHSG